MKKLAQASDDYVRLRNLRCTTANRKSEEDVQLCIASHDMVVARYMAEKNYHSMKLRALTFPKKKREVILDKMLPNVTVREFNKESGRLQAFVESLYATPDSHPFKDE
jgi:hypothetical protein